MQVKQTQAEGLRREFQVTVDADTFKSKVDERLQKVGENAKVPGFRPGKIPVTVLRQRYGKEVLGEVLDRVIQDASAKLLKEQKLRIATKPTVNITAFDEGKPLEFSMSLELFPEIPEEDFSKLTLDRRTFEVADSDIDEGLDRLADRSKKNQKVEKARAAKLGDVVVVDFLGKVDGVPFDGGKAEKFQIEIGSNQLIPGFEDQLVGMKPGAEKVINVTFPDDYHSESLKGKAATFDITLHELLEPVKPTVDEAFAKELGFESLAELRGKIKEQLEKDYGQFVRTILKKQLFDKLDESLTFELPKSLVEQEFQLIWQKVQQAKAEGDKSLDKPEEELRKEYLKVADRRVKLGLFLAEVSGKNNIAVSKEELRDAVIEQAKMFPGQEQRVIEFYRSNPAHVQELQGPILEEKAVDFVLGQVKYKDKKATLPELLKLDEEAREQE